jgi:hypothetical protein
MRHLLVAAFAFLAANRAVAQAPVWRMLPGIHASATQKLVYDSARQRMVRIESSAQGGVFRTWERIGDAWSMRHTLHTPPPRGYFAAAYDPVRGRTVLFGGQAYMSTAPVSMTPIPRLQDVWEYDGVDWVQRSFPTGPQPHSDSHAVFDPASQRLLLLIGWSSTPGPLAWSYDGTAWAAAANPPFSGLNRRIAPHPPTNRVVSYIPAAVGGPGVTWLWDGVQWSQATPLQSPPDRHETMVWDDSIGQAVILSGYSATGVPLNDRWGWNGADWSLLPGPPTPARTMASFAHDAARGVTIGVGGYPQPFGVLLDDTLVWDGASWTGSLDQAAPYVLHACHDDSTGEVVASDYHGCVVAFDGVRWRLRGTVPGNGPTLLAFDRSRQRLVAVRQSTVHEWNGVTWVNLGAAPLLHHMVYDPGRARVVALSSLGMSEWDGTTWTQFGPAPFPSFFTTGLVHDAATNQLMATRYTGSTWTTLSVAAWNGSSWTVTSPPTSPPPREDYAIGFDPVTQRPVVFGGRYHYVTPWAMYADLWEWTGSTWQQRTTTNSPTPRAAAVFVEVPWLQRLVLVGGEDDFFNGAHTWMRDLWALDPVAGSVAAIGPGCGGASGVPSLIASAPVPAAPAFTLDAHSALPNAPALLALSLGTATIPVGGGCTKWLAEPLHLIPLWTDAGGSASATSSIPRALAGFSFAAQLAVWDPSSAIGVSLTGGVGITVGW